MSSLKSAGDALCWALERLYTGCGALAAIFLALIGVLTLTSILSRYFGVLILGLTDYAGYAMAASTFLALAYTFGHRAHIRITLLLHFLHSGPRRLAEIWCLAIGSFLTGYFAYYAVRTVWISYKLNDISQGPDFTPLWIPQIGLAFGVSVLAIAFVHRLVAVILGGELEADEEGGRPLDEIEARHG